MLLILTDIEIGDRKGLQILLNSKIYGVSVSLQRWEVKKQTYQDGQMRTQVAQRRDSLTLSPVKIWSAAPVPAEPVAPGKESSRDLEDV